MFDFLDKIRSKPEHVRRRVLFVTVGLLMFPVILTWMGTLDARFSTTKDERLVYKENTPISALAQTGSAFWSGIKSSTVQVKSQIQEGLKSYQSGSGVVATSSSLVKSGTTTEQGVVSTTMLDTENSSSSVELAATSSSVFATSTASTSKMEDTSE